MILKTLAGLKISHLIDLDHANTVRQRVQASISLRAGLKVSLTAKNID